MTAFDCWSVLCVFVFLFFKQKTAYEMRISDWSSDVCSSDLRGDGPSGVALTAPDTTRAVRRRDAGTRRVRSTGRVVAFPASVLHHRTGVSGDGAGSVVDRKSVV